ncbi:MAE_28990/MAE_18760 family HEPN-like nuclease [Exiguobacterium acetylicum]|uniref:MAE_28990/MAE_18760 family HEPN-like nuclease n=1 Tax=Exiguobacterium acetylicum TaxID=41170 RepID=UPI0039777D07
MSSEFEDIVINIVEDEEELEIVGSETGSIVKSVTVEEEKEKEDQYIETEVFRFLKVSEERWEEIQLLINKASYFQSEKSFYDALCRSTIVLLVGQIEGYIKDLAKAIITDLNDNVAFSDLPRNIKKNFTNYYLGDGGRYTELNDFFNLYNADLKTEPFLGPYSVNGNKNPSANVIDKVMNSFGIDGVFSYLYNSQLDTIFENDHEEISKILHDLQDYLFNKTKSFPYEIDLKIFSLNKHSIKFTKSNRELSLFKTFLDDLLHSRHAVAHGSTFENQLTIEQLVDYERKARALQYGIALILIHDVTIGIDF